MAKKVGLKNVQKDLLALLDGLPIGRKKRAIQSLIHRLNFELRWWSLTKRERKWLECQPLSSEEKAALQREQTPKGREERIKMYARARHLRKVAWMAYLNGDTDEKPPLPVN